MVRFNKKESADRRELLSSLNQMNDAKENENGKRRRKVSWKFIINLRDSFVDIKENRE